MSDSVVATIGYEGKAILDLVDLIRAEGVEVLVDVRLNAMSRKPGFSKRRLGEALAEAGIEYVHEPRLGNPQENRPGLAAGDPASRELYVSRLRGVVRPAYEDVLRLVTERHVALLCYEADHHACHRTCIADQLRADIPGLDVVNL